MLYETLTGSPPFARPSDAATLYAHVADPPPRPSVLRADLGADIDEVIARGLAKQPSQRPPTALRAQAGRYADLSRRQRGGAGDLSAHRRRDRAR